MAIERVKFYLCNGNNYCHNSIGCGVNNKTTYHHCYLTSNRNAAVTTKSFVVVETKNEEVCKA